MLGSGQRLKNPIHDYRLLSNLYGDVEFGYMGDRFQNRQVAALSPRASISSFNPDVDYKMPKSIVIGAGAVVGRAGGEWVLDSWMATEQVRTCLDSDICQIGHGLGPKPFLAQNDDRILNDFVGRR